MKRIIITIPKSGPTKIDMEGYTGEGCKTQADRIVAILGGQNVTEELKPEYYESENSEGQEQTL